MRSGDIVDWVSVWNLHFYTSVVQFVLLYGSEARTLKQHDGKCLQTFHMKAQYETSLHSANHLVWFYYQWFQQRADETCWPFTGRSWSDMPIWATLSTFLKNYRLIPCYSMLSTSLTSTLLQAGSVHQVDHGNMATTSHHIAGLWH